MTLALLLAATACGSSSRVEPISGGAVEFLGMGEHYAELGELLIVADVLPFAEQWMAHGLAGDPPNVAFQDAVVAFVTISDDACPPTLTGLRVDDDGLITPMFVETATSCIQPLVPKTFVFTVSRDVSGRKGFTLRLPSDGLSYDEQRLEVAFATDGTVATRLLTSLPTRPTIPTTTLAPP